MLRRLNLVLTLALAVVFVLLALMQVDNSRPNYQVQLGDDMTYSPAYTSFEANPNFPNGRTLQDPVPGTLARGEQLLHFEATPQDAIRAGEKLVNPFELETEQGIAAAERGQKVYRAFCIACHGGDGSGKGLVAQRGFPPPPSLLTGKSLEMKDGQLFHILTFGQNTMPQFAAQLPPDRRWDVISHIRSLQQHAKSQAEAAATATATTSETTSASETALPADGAETFPPKEAKATTQPTLETPAQADTESQP